jgi:hypothetical protein
MGTGVLSTAWDGEERQALAVVVVVVDYSP